MDLNKSIRMAVDTGNVVFGADKARKLALGGAVKAIVVASNCPPVLRQDLEHYCAVASIPIIRFGGTGMSLGTVCGKPFTVSALSIVAEGNSDIISAIKQ